MSRGTDLAFPSAPTITPEGLQIDSKEWGMTLREYYAGLALQGYLASHTGQMVIYKNAADVAVECADALLKRLEQPS